uniref:Uncharacterized protein n=1 Tax=Anguilla anguilla TaxID=7936 RepID=A0A0E9PEV0_ANGAN
MSRPGSYQSSANNVKSQPITVKMAVSDNQVKRKQRQNLAAFGKQ